MSTTFRGYAVAAEGAPRKLIEFDPGSPRDEPVEIAVEYCGICHSDLSVADNERGMTTYPFVPGREVVGRIAAAGPRVKRLKVGQRIGLGGSRRVAWPVRSVCPARCSAAASQCSTQFCNAASNRPTAGA